MPPFGACEKVVIFSIICLFLVIRNAGEPVNQDEDEPLSFCMLGPDEGGTSKFTLGEKEYLVCREGRFFDNTTNEQGVPKGCTLCQPNITYMDSRNFCQQCKACRDCNINEEEDEECTIKTDRKCIPRSNVTGGSDLEATTKDSITGPESTTEGKTVHHVNRSTSPPCQQGVSCTTIHQDPSVTTTRQEQSCTDVTVLTIICSILLGVILIVVVQRLILKLRHTWKKQDNGNGNNPVNDDQQPQARQGDPFLPGNENPPAADSAV